MVTYDAAYVPLLRTKAPDSKWRSSTVFVSQEYNQGTWLQIAQRLNFEAIGPILGLINISFITWEQRRRFTS